MSTPASINPDLIRLVPTSARSAQRLYLEPTGAHQGMLDGAWWPRSRNPAVELPGLIMMIDGIRGRVLRLVLSATGWDERPRRLKVAGRTVILDYFGTQPASLLTAICVLSRADLLVIPPSTGRESAHAAMVHAIITGNRRTAAVTHPAKTRDTTPSSHFDARESEGGEVPEDLRFDLPGDGWAGVAAASQSWAS
jgi:hypothetical protein